MGATVGKSQYKVVRFIETKKYISRYSLVKICETEFIEEAMLFRDRLHTDNFLKQFHGKLEPVQLLDVSVEVTLKMHY